MGNFSRVTYNRLKHYVSVRLQQGVPLVDADWNEREDIRRYELQAYLKWFVGDGVPMGSSGFFIRPRPGFDNDFYIRTGRCLVDGLDVINEGLIVDGEVVNDFVIAYSEQTLTDTAIADALGVDPVPPLITPTADGDYTVYLDIWEREVLPGNIGDDAYVFDRNLINEDIGLETCTRTKREWVVRVVEGTTLPVPPPDSGHILYPLARIARRNGDAVIYQQDITDLRRIDLKVGSYNDTQQIVRDAFGDTYTLDGDGEPDLKVSLRETINALLRGAVPTAPAAQLSLDSAFEFRPHAMLDSIGDTWVFWHSNRGGNNDIWYRRYDQTAGTWGPDVQLTADAANDSEPKALIDQEGTVWVFWRSYRSGNYAVWCDRLPIGGGWMGPEQVSSGTQADYYIAATVDEAGQIWVFWHSYRSGNYNIYHNRRPPGGTWVGESALTSDAGADRDTCVTIDAEGRPFIVWHSDRNGNYDIYYKYYDPVDGWSTDQRLTYDAGHDYITTTVTDGDGNVWVFWHSYRNTNYDIWCKRGRYIIDAYGYGYWNWSSEIQLTTDAAADQYPVAVVDTQGDVWVFWRAYRYGSYGIWYKRYSRGGGWSNTKPLGAEYGYEPPYSYTYNVMPMIDSEGDIRVFWNYEWEDLGYSYNVEIWHNKLIPQI